jgi:hypothetical protein
MYHDGPTSTGSNTSEIQLTPSNVSSSTFGKLFEVQVDGQVYAQPLVATRVNITTGASPGIHDVVFVTTENDSLYAIDADSSGGQILWQRSFLTAGLPGATSITPVPVADVGGSIGPMVGITGTPVIDKTTNTLYVIAKTKETVGGVAHYVQRIYAVNMSNGTNQTAPFLIGDTTGSNTNNTPVYVYGSGDGSVTDPYNATGNPVVQFNALRENERVALSLVGGVVYAGWASPGDISPYHGWLIGFDPSTLALRGAFNTTPNGGLGGIWQAGGSISTDGKYLYFQVGNGTFDGNNGATGNVTTAPGPVTGLDANGFPVDGDYGDSFLKVGLDPSTTPTHQNLNGWGLKIVDYFTPTNQYYLNANDLDVGSGGSMLLPPGVGSVAHPDLLLGGGKGGTLYLIDRDNMGKFGTTDQAVQELTGQFSGVYATAAYSGGTIYVAGPGGPAMAFSIADAVMSSSPVSQSTDSYGYPGSTPSISSNGSLGGINGIVWDIDAGTNELRAYSSVSYGTELYNSDQAPNGRDALGVAVTFEVPTVANGRVFVGTGGGGSGNDLVAYGIISPPGAAPAAPNGLTTTTLDASRIKLAWSDHDVAPNWADYFSVEMSTGGTHFTAVANVSAGTTTFTMTGLSPATTYDFRVRAINSQGDSGYTNVSGTTTASVATFLKSDTTTEGTWIHTYGAQGYDVINNAVNPPSYATVTPSGQLSYTWASSTTDPRALQTADGSSRIAACWYSGSSFKVNVDLTDGLTHDLELYFVDWDSSRRAETVVVSDAASGAVLSTQSISSFHAGVYLNYAVRGNIVITITKTAGDNAVLSGLFFDPAVTMATFLKSDTTTEGTWMGTYGAQGYDVINDAAGLPTYASVTPSGQSSYTWASSTYDPRALQTADGSSRIAACWYSASSFTVNVDLTDGLTHDLKLYFVDWDSSRRAETVQISNAVTGAVLSTQSISSFHAGVYLNYAISGDIVITITRTAGDNAVLSGLFLG